MPLHRRRLPQKKAGGAHLWDHTSNKWAILDARTTALGTQQMTSEGEGTAGANHCIWPAIQAGRMFNPLLNGELLNVYGLAVPTCTACHKRCRGWACWEGRASTEGSLHQEKDAALSTVGQACSEG